MIKIGRNDPCPCGSGKKDKKCCYNDEEKNRKIERAQNKAEIKEDLIKFINEKIAVYVHKMDIKICGKTIRDAEIGFSDELNTGFNILGRKSIFNHFEICFNDNNKTVMFHY